MCMRAFRPLAMICCLLVLAVGGLAPRSEVVVAPPQPPPNPSYWGMNLYLAKRERLGRDNFGALATTARSVGVQWTREELPWALIEQTNNTFTTSHYDAYLNLAVQHGFGIIGMLLTTPEWARDSSCRTLGAGYPPYWCPPANVQEYAQFASYMVERYDGDGVSDATGSPRIAAWEIWNEPNNREQWPDIGADGNARKRRYGELLVAAFQAIKAADPTAKVLIGGVYIFDGNNPGGNEDGLYFLNAVGGVFQQVPSAKQAFDVFSIHPYIPTVAPDAPQIPPRITVEGRVHAARTWLNDAVGRSAVPIWITEIGWCTEGNCPGGVPVTEEQQANYLTRAMVLAQQHGVEHTSWFQFDDAFDDLGREWGGAAIVRAYSGSRYPPKPAYAAYRTLAEQLAGAAPAGTGPVHTHVYQARADFGHHDEIYDYRYTRGTTVDYVLWRPLDARQVVFPVASTSQVTVVDRDGGQTAIAATGGAVQLTVSERPIFVVQK